MSGLTKSPWIIHYDGSSCNGCDIEVLACLTPMYDVERFGIINTGNPKHADIFLVTGSVNEQNISVVKQIYEQMPNPKVVVAIGICATSGGIFKECYNIKGGVDTVIPVDVYVPGCAARPEAIIDGVVKGLGVLAEKKANMPKTPYAPVEETAGADERQSYPDEDDEIEVRVYGDQEDSAKGAPEEKNEKEEA
jgi:ech hydrogenase subunit C